MGPHYAARPIWGRRFFKAEGPELANFPLHSRAMVKDLLGVERKVATQTQNFTDGLYNQPMNKTKRPYSQVHEMLIDFRKLSRAAILLPSLSLRREISERLPE